MPMVVAIRGLAIVSALALGGCTTNDVVAPVGPVATAPAAASGTAFADCPQVTLREGTGSMSRPVGQGSVGANITEIRSRCTISDGLVSVEVSVRGTVAAQGDAAGGEVAVPIRVAALSGERVVYSNLGSQDASAGTTGEGTFSYVDTGLRVPASEAAGLQIFAGFDEMS